MAKISKITIDGSDYTLKDSRLITLEDNSTTTAGTWLAKCDNLSSYSDGQLFLYKLTKAGASTTTLNINNIGAKTVYRHNNIKLTTHYSIGSILCLTYCSSLNSGCFMVVNDYDATNSNTIPAAYCNTAAATAAKVATHTDYALLTNSYELVTIKNANSYNGAITLNINSKGAKPIYINGAASSSSNKTLPAGTYLVFYDGTNYYFNTDGKVKGLVSSAGGTMTGDLQVNAKINLATPLEGTIGSINSSRAGISISSSGSITLNSDTAYLSGKTTIDGTDIPKNDTLEVTSNRVSSWSTTTTDTHYPSEKLVKDECDNIREVAEGKCKTSILLTDETAITEANFSQFTLKKYDGTIIQSWAEFVSWVSNNMGDAPRLCNSEFIKNDDILLNSPSRGDYLLIDAYYSTYTVIALYRFTLGYADSFQGFKTGDIFLVTNTEVPDRWIGLSHNVYQGFYKLETSKVDLSGYVNAADTGLKLVANGTSGKKVQHTNSVTAKTTQGLVKVAYDAQGHITGSTAVAKGDLTGLGVADDSNVVHKGTSSSSVAEDIYGVKTFYNNLKMYDNNKIIFGPSSLSDTYSIGMNGITCGSSYTITGTDGVILKTGIPDFLIGGYNAEGYSLWNQIASHYNDNIGITLKSETDLGGNGYAKMPISDGSSANNYYTVATNEGIAKGLSTINIGTSASPVYSALAIKSKDYATADDIVHLSVDGGSAKGWPKTLAIDSAVYSSSNFNVEGYLNIGGNTVMTGGYVAKFGGKTKVEGDFYTQGNIYVGSNNTLTYPITTINPDITLYGYSIRALSFSNNDSYEIHGDENGWKFWRFKEGNYTSYFGYNESYKITAYINSSNKHKIIIDIHRPSAFKLVHGTISAITTIGHKWYTSNNEIYLKDVINADIWGVNGLSMTKPDLDTYYYEIEYSSSVPCKSSSSSRLIYGFNGNGSMSTTLKNITDSTEGNPLIHFMATELDTNYSGDLYLHDWHVRVVLYEK